MSDKADAIDCIDQIHMCVCVRAQCMNEHARLMRGQNVFQKANRSIHQIIPWCSSMIHTSPQSVQCVKHVAQIFPVDFIRNAVAPENVRTLYENGSAVHLRKNAEACSLIVGHQKIAFFFFFDNDSQFPWIASNWVNWKLASLPLSVQQFSIEHSFRCHRSVCVLKFMTFLTWS